MFTTEPGLTPKGRTFLLAVIVLLALMVVSSLIDQVINMLPLRVSQVDWRFAAAGSFLASLPQYAMQLALLTVVAAFGAGRLTVRYVAILAVVFGLLGAVVLLPFMLDLIQARRQVPLDRQANFTIAALKTAGFGGLFSLAFLWTGWSGLKLRVRRSSSSAEGKRGRWSSSE